MISTAKTRIGVCLGLRPPLRAPGIGAIALILSACATSSAPTPEPRPVPVAPESQVQLEDLIFEEPSTPDPVAPAEPNNQHRFSSLAGWSQNDARGALMAFVASCERINPRADNDWMNPRVRYAGRVGDWRDVCLEATMIASMPLTSDGARDFFERNFTPVSVRHSGKLTGYYEPVLEARAQPDMEFSMAIRAKPGDMLSGDLGQFIAGLEGERIIGRAQDQDFVPYVSRAEIEAQNLGVPLAWGRPIDVFFLQIQGSGRLSYPDGGEARVRFSAHNGLDYVSIGRILIRRGELEPHNASKQDIEAWLNARGPLSWRPLFDENPRYVFFSLETDIDHDVGPIGSQGAALTPMASLAVDPAHHAWGVPIFLQAAIHGESNWSGLVIAQDTGGAIRGPARGDLFFGWGYEAGERAGRQNDDHARWTLLLPHHLADR